MEPQIQYARTRDGVSIAFARTGSGSPLVMAPNLWANIGLFFDIVPDFIRNNIANGREVICLDGRGTGASERNVDEVSLETRLLDLEAVVDHLGLAGFILMGLSHGGPAAVAYAARHPDKVAHLILMTTYANGADYYKLAPVMRALASIQEMASDQWEFYTRTAANAVLGYGSPEIADWLAAQYRDSITSRVLVMYREASQRTDVTSILKDVACPTLVVDDRASALRVEQLSRELATGIPVARLVSFDGGGPFGGERTGAAIAEFLHPGVAAQIAGPALPSAFRTVLFTDLVDHTEMMQRLGDAKGRDVLREHERITRETLKTHGGAEVKTMGDGFMASFGSVTSAIDCAIALQRAVAAFNVPSPLDGEGLGVRCGLNAGEPIEEDGDLFGSTVIMASRIAAKAGAGEILIPEPLRHLLSGKSYVYADRGETVLKGFEDAVRLYEVRWRE